MSGQYGSSTRASVSLRGVEYDVTVSVVDGQLKLHLEDRTSDRAWSGSFAGTCTRCRNGLPFALPCILRAIFPCTHVQQHRPLLARLLTPWHVARVLQMQDRLRRLAVPLR